MGLSATAAGAQQPGAELVLPVGSDGRAVDPKALAAQLLPGAQDSAPPLTTDAAAFCLRGARGFSPQRLRGLQELDGLLAQAQRQAAALDEGAALSSLALAARVGAGLLDLPGIAAWQAEIELRTALVAAQAGRPRLADAALRRAASLDLERRLMAAEATPQVVEQAGAIWQQVRSAPEGRLRITADAPGARVFLDDMPVGDAPLTLSARAGRHILRIEAPGRLAHGTFLDLIEGQRPPFEVALSPDPLVSVAAELRKAAAAADLEAVVELLGQLSSEQGPGRGVWLVQSGQRDGRLLASRCTRSGCGATRTLDSGAAGEAAARAPALGSAQAAAWLDEPPPVAPGALDGDGGVPGWVVWGGAMAATALAAVVTALLSDGQSEPQRQLNIVVDPGDAAN